jgi:Alcohol dehydrogenase GroES-like domain
VKASGIREFSDPVELLELPGPRALRPDEVLIDVRACGMGNWDEIARKGGWDLGVRPPMALGVEAAGLVAAVGNQVDGVRAGDRVTTHSLPLREQGAWATVIATAGPDSVDRLAALGAAGPGRTRDTRLRRRAGAHDPVALPVQGRDGVGGQVGQAGPHQAGPGEGVRVRRVFGLRDRDDPQACGGG